MHHRSKAFSSLQYLAILPEKISTGMVYMNKAKTHLTEIRKLSQEGINYLGERARMYKRTTISFSLLHGIHLNLRPADQTFARFK